METANYLTETFLLGGVSVEPGDKQSCWWTQTLLFTCVLLSQCCISAQINKSICIGYGSSINRYMWDFWVGVLLNIIVFVFGCLSSVLYIFQFLSIVSSTASESAQQRCHQRIYVVHYYATYMFILAPSVRGITLTTKARGRMSVGLVSPSSVITHYFWFQYRFIIVVMCLPYNPTSLNTYIIFPILYMWSNAF